jgi:hypothetical protein
MLKLHRKLWAAAGQKRLRGLIFGPDQSCTFGVSSFRAVS